MRNTLALFTIILSMVLMSACARVQLREDIFLSQPLWESSKFHKFKTSDNKVNIDINEAPGLALLVHQVLGEEDGFIDEREVKAHFAGKLVAPDLEPLPPELASLNVTKAIVKSIKASVEGMNKPKTEQKNGQKKEKLPNIRLSLGEFKKFVEELSKSSLRPYQSVKDHQHSRDKKIRIFTEHKKITWDGLLVSYLTAYYNGEFVDRNGGTYSKPQIDLTITNETITALTAIFIEALVDYAIVDGKIKAPIVYKTIEVDEKVTKVFLTAKNKTPTLVKVVKKLTGEDDLEYVIERVPASSAEPGITKQKLNFIQFASGLAGESSQSLVGTIVRAFGGVNLGIVVFGRLSIGDNDTLSKLVDTIVENTSKRTTEIFLLHTLYDLTYGEQGDLTAKFTEDQKEAWRLLQSNLTIGEWVSG
jgi:hypothetical protein